MQVAIPKHITRRFSRLAGLLELGDQEFITIRNELKKYEEDVPANIAKAPQDVDIDKVSLSIFYNTNSLLKKLDSEIMGFVDATTRVPDSESMQHDVKILNYCGIKTIAELENHLRLKQKMIISFARKWLEGSKSSSFPSGISIFYLFYVFAAQTVNFEQVKGYLDFAEIDSVKKRVEIAHKALKIYSEIINQ